MSTTKRNRIRRGRKNSKGPRIPWNNSLTATDLYEDRTQKRKDAREKRRRARLRKKMEEAGVPLQEILQAGEENHNPEEEDVKENKEE